MWHHPLCYLKKSFYLSGLDSKSITLRCVHFPIVLEDGRRINQELQYTFCSLVLLVSVVKSCIKLL